MWHHRNLTPELGRNGERMSRTVMFLLPCRPVVQRLEIGKRWWHRLGVVVFFKLLLTTLLTVAAASYLTLAPRVRDYPGVLEIIPLFDVSAAALQNEHPLHKIQEPRTVQMPDGTWATFPINMSDEAIHTLWTRAKRHQLLSAIFWAALVSVFATLAVNYVFQGVYRLLLYTFGSKSLKASDSIAA
jgi:hypothetical protein